MSQVGTKASGGIRSVLRGVARYVGDRFPVLGDAGH